MVVNGTSCSISLWLFTIYDLKASARCAGFGGAGASGMLRSRAQEAGADGGGENAAHVRCTICEFARVARNLAERVRAGCRETVRGRSYKATLESMKSPVSTHRKLGTGKGKYKGLKIFPSGHKVPPPCTSGQRAKATTPATNNWRNFQPACRG